MGSWKKATCAQSLREHAEKPGSGPRCASQCGPAPGQPARYARLASSRLRLARGEARGPDGVCSHVAPPSSGRDCHKPHCKSLRPLEQLPLPGHHYKSVGSRTPAAVTETPWPLHPAGLWLTQGLAFSLVTMKTAKCVWNGREQSSPASASAGISLLVTACFSLPHARPGPLPQTLNGTHQFARTPWCLFIDAIDPCITLAVPVWEQETGSPKGVLAGMGFQPRPPDLQPPALPTALPFSWHTQDNDREGDKATHKVSDRDHECYERMKWLLFKFYKQKWRPSRKSQVPPFLSSSL